MSRAGASLGTVSSRANASIAADSITWVLRETLQRRIEHSGSDGALAPER